MKRYVYSEEKIFAFRMVFKMSGYRLKWQLYPIHRAKMSHELLNLPDTDSSGFTDDWMEFPHVFSIFLPQ